MARRSPQEKKRLSYERDRRNEYGENTTASRRGIRIRKRSVNRANRNGEAAALRAALGPADDAAADDAESRVKGRRPKRWRKVPDVPLGEVVERKLNRREKRRGVQ